MLQNLYIQDVSVDLFFKIYEMHNTNNPKLTFNLSIDEANLIFKALGKLPFAEVYELIGKLNEQANGQLQNQNNIKPEDLLED